METDGNRCPFQIHPNKSLLEQRPPTPAGIAAGMRANGRKGETERMRTERGRERRGEREEKETE